MLFNVIRAFLRLRPSGQNARCTIRFPCLGGAMRRMMSGAKDYYQKTLCARLVDL